MESFELASIESAKDAAEPVCSLLVGNLEVLDHPLPEKADCFSCNSLAMRPPKTAINWEPVGSGISVFHRSKSFAIDGSEAATMSMYPSSAPRTRSCSRNISSLVMITVSNVRHQSRRVAFVSIAGTLSSYSHNLCSMFISGQSIYPGNNASSVMPVLNRIARNTNLRLSGKCRRSCIERSESRRHESRSRYLGSTGLGRRFVLCLVKPGLGCVA